MSDDNRGKWRCVWKQRLTFSFTLLRLLLSAKYSVNRQRYLYNTKLSNNPPGTLLKQGSRIQFWHERYFTFSSDHTLKYYKSKDDIANKIPPKASYCLSKLQDLCVSDVYADGSKKELIYCVKLTWSSSESNEDSLTAASSLQLQNQRNRDLSFDDDLSAPSMVSDQLESRPLSSPVANSRNDARNSARGSVKKSPFRRFRRKPNLERNSSLAGSVDRESLTLDSGDGRPASVASKPQIIQRQRSSATNGRRSTNEGGEVPMTVEVANGETKAQPDSARSMSTQQTRNTSAIPVSDYERQRQEDLRYLEWQFLTAKEEKRKKKKKQMVTGTKIAAGVGAAVGITIVTAGIGLVAGLIILGAGAAAGGGSAAVEATFKNGLRKKSCEIVMASNDYELICTWRTYLSLSVDSDSIKKSTWGQLFVSDGRKSNAALLPRILVFPKEKHPTAAMLDSTGREKRDFFALDSVWRPMEGGWASLLGSGTQGLRIFREEEESKASQSVPQTQTASRRHLYMSGDDGRAACPPMKAHVVLSTTPIDAFMCVMSYGRITNSSISAKDPAVKPLRPNTGQRASFRVVERIDDHTDIIHLVFRPVYLFPSWTAPRDYCLFRYWRLEQDGSYVICYESMQHPRCPHMPEYVRGEMHQVVTISPQKMRQRGYRSRRQRTAESSMSGSPTSSGPMKSQRQNFPLDCLMTAVVQVDPKGWVPTTPLAFLGNQGYADAFAVSTLSQLLDVRDAIDHDRFLHAHSSLKALGQSMANLGSGLSPSPMALMRNRSIDSVDDEPTMISEDDGENYDFAYADHESKARIRLNSLSESDLALNPPPLPYEKWAEPDSNSFRVRGATYKRDRVKVNAGPSIGRLVAADVVTSDGPIYSGFSAHPTERIQRALRKEQELKRQGRQSDMPPFIFVVTIVLPGPPFYYGVYYFAVDDMSTIDGTDGTPSSRLCNRFFFGDSDDFRDKTFKLIPQIVQGNFIVRKAVGSTPAIMGTKLRQLYVKSDRYFEVILDCGSDPVATGVIRLSLSYAKTLVLDMGFLFEGAEDDVLPERMFGAVRMKRVEFGNHLRFVEQPEVVERANVDES